MAVSTHDGEGNPCTVFYPGQRLVIRVMCESAISIDRLCVAVRLRNKEGVKIYSWGTLNQDISRRFAASEEPLFWTRAVSAGERFEVELECDCHLGVNLYEIQTSVTYEETPDYLSQRQLHWVDEAAFFQVLMRNDEYFFGGVVDLRMHARWRQLEQSTG